MRPLFAAGVLLTACASFDSSDSSASDAGVEGATPDAGADSSALPARGCPKPVPPTMGCYDFDEGAAPTGVVNNGALDLDTSQFWSPPRSLLVTTKGAPSVTEAYFTHAIGGAPKNVVVDQRIRVTRQLPETEIGSIQVRGADRFYAALFVLKGSTLELLDGTYLTNGSLIDTVRHDLGTIRTEEWIQVTVRLELDGFTGANPQRTLSAEVDGVSKVTASGGAPGAGTNLNPTQTVVALGISYAGITPETPRRLNVDDAIITWTP